MNQPKTPKVRLTDPQFKYVRSDKTDLKKTFARVRKQISTHQAQGGQRGL